MKIIVHRGTHQIGGCVTEIQSNSGTRIAIDIGENLPSQDKKSTQELDIEGLTIQGQNNFKAVCITHYHGDHIGLYHKILPQIPIYIGKVSKEIYKILQTRLAKANIISEEDLARIEHFKTYQIPEKITIGDIFKQMAKQEKYKIASNTKPRLLEYFSVQKHCENFSNARFVRNFFEKVKFEQADRIAKEEQADINFIKKCDIEKVIRKTQVPKVEKMKIGFAS